MAWLEFFLLVLLHFLVIEVEEHLALSTWWGKRGGGVREEEERKEEIFLGFSFVVESSNMLRLKGVFLAAAVHRVVAGV